MSPPSSSNALLATRDLKAGAAEAAAVHLSGVTRVFAVTAALVRVDLRVERGEAVMLRGPNGAGKSTLLAVVATLLSPTYGTGSVLGFDLAREHSEIRRRTELLGHRTRLYEDLTALENLRFACALFGIDRARAGEALERVGLADVAAERVRGFSQGMRQRVAVARAMLRSAELLLLDEPYAGLDAEAKAIVDLAVVDARRQGQTVMLATHDPTRTALVERTIEMDGGRIVSDVASDVPGTELAREGANS